MSFSVMVPAFLAGWRDVPLDGYAFRGVPERDGPASTGRVKAVTVADASELGGEEVKN